ncbi:hypothetical protein [Parasphingorhabdus sp.]|uniref:hypothetical protein n=1 Tax=Parasphingorhabdus sp. TaxID=2709688 RepID=UPI002B26FAEE|nr:hypothetical protein [Parasphingorhabdus sp.]
MHSNMLIVPLADADLGAALNQGGRLVAKATGYGLAFALDQLGDIDIPEPHASQIDRAQLRALATLYLAAELEPAGIIPTAELLAGLSTSGGLNIDLGPAGSLVAGFWRQRNNRATAMERNAFFSRLFGTAGGPVSADADRNFQFEDHMLSLCEALYKLDEMTTIDRYGGVAQQTRVRSAARAVGQNLVTASGGITAFMAGEITATLKEAFAIIGHPHLRQLFGARDVWGVVAAINRQVGRAVPPASPYIQRGKSGMTVISWLADVATELGGSRPIVEIGHPVVAAAIEWLQAALRIGEMTSAAPSPGSAQPAGANPNMSPWAAFGS